MYKKIDDSFNVTHCIKVPYHTRFRVSLFQTTPSTFPLFGYDTVYYTHYHINFKTDRNDMARPYQSTFFDPIKLDSVRSVSG